MIKYNFINQVGGGLALRRGREIGQRKDFLPTASLFIFQKQEWSISKKKKKTVTKVSKKKFQKFQAFRFYFYKWFYF